MKIFFLVIIIIFCLNKLFDFILNKRNSKVVKQKELFKSQIKDFSIKFLQPLLNDSEKYPVFKPLSIEQIKIYIKLLKDEYQTDFISDDFTALKLEKDKFDIKNNFDINDDEYKAALKEMIEVDKIINNLEKKWNVADSISYLNELYFDLLFKVFIKNFSITNPDCVDKWDSIKECYVKTFDNNLNYLPYINKYIKIKNIESPENIEQDIQSYIEAIILNKQACEYRKIMENEEKFSKDIISISDIDTMSGIEFEKFLERLFTKLNYEVSLTKATGDQGADLIVKKFDKLIIVQAKRYNSTVSNKAIQEAVAAIKFYNASSAMVITNNYYTKSAIKLANANNVELWDRDKLNEQLSLYQISF